MTSSLTIEERIILNRFKIWFSCFIGILNKYPELKKIKSIGETIEVSKYFLAPMSRFIVELVKLGKNKKIEQITHIYGKQKFNNLEYYHLDISKDYSAEYINYISNIYGIKIFLQYLTGLTKIDFNKYDNYNSKEIINLLVHTYTKTSTNTKTNNQILNLFLNNYIKIFPNVFVVIQFNSSKDIKNNSIKSTGITNTNTNELENNLLYENELNIDGKILSNIMFNIFQNYTYTQRLDIIKSIDIKKNYLINYRIYETISQIDFFDMFNIGSNSNIFVLFDKSSKIRFSSIFFNSNTLDMFKNHHVFCDYISYKDNSKNINKKFINKNTLMNLIYFQTLKKWLFSTYSGNEIENVIIGEIDSSSIDTGIETETEKKIFGLNKLVVIDNITTNLGRVKKIKHSKIFFVEIIFLKISQYKQILSKNKKIIGFVSNYDFQWELEGIKFFTEKIKF